MINIKKRLVVILAVASIATSIFVSCGKKIGEDPKVPYPSFITPDSCEYWIVLVRGSYNLVHKKDCKNHDGKHCAFCHKSF
jgi:hypothetical protein